MCAPSPSALGSPCTCHPWKAHGNFVAEQNSSTNSMLTCREHLHICGEHPQEGKAKLHSQRWRYQRGSAIQGDLNRDNENKKDDSKMRIFFDTWTKGNVKCKNYHPKVEWDSSSNHDPSSYHEKASLEISCWERTPRRFFWTGITSWLCHFLIDLRVWPCKFIKTFDDLCLSNFATKT